MGKSNRSARHEIEQIYGKGCMFDKANIVEKIEKIGTIKTYKKYEQQIRYKKAKMIQMKRTISYHHLKHKSEGGRATVENGANINAFAHAYLHSLPRQQEEIINDMLREYKESFVLNIATLGAEGIREVKKIELPEVEEDYIEIPVEPMTEKEMQIYQEHKRKRNERVYRRFGEEYER